MAKDKKDELDAKLARQALEYLFAARYIDRKRLYWENFLRGAFFGVGSAIGAAILIAIIIWFLSLFKHIPLIGHFVQSWRHSVESIKTTR